jgi:peptidoglycan hydrolase-like protein with peptidoglycan-binding domain
LLSQQDENNEARIRAAQRALIKLGYVLRDNGILGPTTEQAIEIYERRNNLPITGTLSKQVIDMMARQSGLSIP